MFSSKSHSSHKSHREHREHRDHTSMKDVKITLENLVAVLNSAKYKSGIDPETMIYTIDDIFAYVSGDSNIRIRTPAPIDNLDDRFGFMWPEGARVTSRAPSEGSRASRQSNRSRHLSAKFTSGNIEPDLMKSALSVTSSQYSSRYVGFIEEEDEQPPVVQVQRPAQRRFGGQRRPSNASARQGTVKVNGGVMKPSPSLERMFAGSSIADDSLDGDELDIENRPVSNRRNVRSNAAPLPIRTSGGHPRSRAVGFDDE
ncbi:hypothetical protein NW766_012861 [Fusarium irregulare]|uniref:Uncharacterized protein n=1 Tax=Fusarium irregulare TaxID=2494466 RepID=A0A9W8PDE1_9HYPO|nr:hypothetical protein NW766_012861 [Fusarium irregulare]